MIEKIKLQKFTVFNNIEIKLSKGINIFIGENGTGKTHLLKLLYSVLSAPSDSKKTAEKIANVFLPKERRIGRLVQRAGKSLVTNIEIFRNGKALKLEFSNHAKDTIKWNNGWRNEHFGQSIYIPVKEMLANAPGFSSLYQERVIYFEEIYRDIIVKAFLPPLKGPVNKERKILLEMIRKVIEGKVIAKDECFYLKNSEGELEFTLLAEGMRKLGLIWLLIQNGVLENGTALFWDEPEANLNPKLLSTAVSILLALESLGVQIFVATHSDVLIKELEFQRGTQSILYHGLTKNQNQISIQSENSYGSLLPTAISDSYDKIYNQQISRDFGE